MPVDALAAHLGAAWADLSARLGDLGVAQAVFIDRLSTIATDLAPHQPLARVESLYLEDYYLVMGCLAHSDRAVRLFFSRYADVLRKSCFRHAITNGLGEDVYSQLIETLFLPRHPNEPDSARLASYRGIGSLKGWLRVTARRLVIDLTRRHRQHDTDEHLAKVPTPMMGADETLEQLEAVARLRPVIVDAFAELTDEERLILYRYYGEGQTLKELGESFGRDTTWGFRRLNKAREKVWRAVIRTARARHGLSDRDLSGLIGGLADDLDLTALFMTALVLAWL